MIASAGNKNTAFIFFSLLFLLSLCLAAWFRLYYLAGIPFGVLIFYAGWKYPAALFLLLIFTLPFSTELQVTASLGTDFPDELLMVAVALLFTLYWIYSPSILPQEILKHPLIFFLLIVFAWSVVATICSTHPLISLKYLLAKSWYLGAFVLAPLILFNGKERIKSAALVMATSFLAIIVIVLCRHYRYGFSFAGINDALHPFFRNHVNYSAMLVCIIPVFRACYLLSKTRPVRRLLIFSLIILLAALFLSYSRGAWLALVAGMAAWWLIKRKMIVASYVTLIIIVLSSLFWLKAEDRYLEYAHHYRTTIFHENFREHLTATYELKDMSTAERFYRWIAGVRMIRDNPVTGYGPNTFYDNYRPYAVPAFKTYVSDNKEHSTVHNYFLLLAIEQGIPALVFFLILAGAMLYYAQYLYHRIRDQFYRVAAISAGTITVMILIVNFLSDLVETDKVGSLFYLVLSVLIMTDINTRNVSDSSPDIQRVP